MLLMNLHSAFVDDDDDYEIMHYASLLTKDLHALVVSSLLGRYYSGTLRTFGGWSNAINWLTVGLIIQLCGQLDMILAMFLATPYISGTRCNKLHVAMCCSNACSGRTKCWIYAVWLRRTMTSCDSLCCRSIPFENVSRCDTSFLLFCYLFLFILCPEKFCSHFVRVDSKHMHLKSGLCVCHLIDDCFFTCWICHHRAYPINTDPLLCLDTIMLFALFVFIYIFIIYEFIIYLLLLLLCTVHKL